MGGGIKSLVLNYNGVVLQNRSRGSRWSRNYFSEVANLNLSKDIIFTIIGSIKQIHQLRARDGANKDIKKVEPEPDPKLNDFRSEQLLFRPLIFEKPFHV